MPCAHQQPAPHASDQGGRAASGLAQQSRELLTVSDLHCPPHQAQGRKPRHTLQADPEWIEFMLCHGLVDNCILNTHFGLPFVSDG